MGRGHPSPTPTAACQARFPRSSIGVLSYPHPRIEHVFDSRSFVHLDVRSYFSLRDGANPPEEVAMAAAEQGIAAVALADRDGLYGAARFVDACHSAGVRPILGATLTVSLGGAGLAPAPSGEAGPGTRPGPQQASLVLLADEAGVRAVATNAVRYLAPGDAFVADAMECMREIVPVADHHVTRTNSEGWLKPPADMRRLFA